MSISALRDETRELFGYLHVSQYADLETIADQIDSHEDELSDLHGGGDAPTPEGSVVWMSARLKELAKEAKEVADRVDELETSLKTATDRISDLEGELEEAQAEFQHAEAG